jgi:hypothetical protein
MWATSEAAMIKPIQSRMSDDGSWEFKDAYLRKDGEPGYIGLHATGLTQDDGFHNLEAWANVYDENKKFKASIFRIFGPIEETVEDMEAEGWVVVEWEKV